MLYSMRSMEATAAPPRVVDAHSLLHLQAPKSARACAAADLVDGLAILQGPTLRIAAAAYGVSLGSVARARRLTPEQRLAVKHGERPLVLPRTPASPPKLPTAPVPPAVPTTPPLSPAIADAKHSLERIVRQVGFNTVLDLLAATEKVAA
jgi:hypothetical protein